VVVIASTNRKDLLDPALLRPGRFDLLVELPLPDRQARLDILRIHSRQMPLADATCLEALADQTEGLSGADLESLCHRAAVLAIRAFLEQPAQAEAPAAAQGPGPDLTLDLLQIRKQHLQCALAERRRLQ
jgi:transitional endoplasmic reticulum ATPase